MEFRVKKMFKDFDGSFKKPGDTVEADGARAIKLHQYGFIGGTAETEKIEPPEKAVKEKPKNKKKGKGFIDAVEETARIKLVEEENIQEKE